MLQQYSKTVLCFFETIGKDMVQKLKVSYKNTFSDILHEREKNNCVTISNSDIY